MCNGYICITAGIPPKVAVMLIVDANIQKVKNFSPKKLVYSASFVDLIFGFVYLTEFFFGCFVNIFAE